MRSNKEITRTINNKLMASFTSPELLCETLEVIKSKYEILYGKIFILESPDSDELICTYSVDMGNVDSIMGDTILVHRKKETNTLYTINALNEVIKSKNGGKLNPEYSIDWREFQNTLLITQNDELKILKTKIKEIIEI